jgi:hypothetical protein
MAPFRKQFSAERLHRRSGPREESAQQASGNRPSSGQDGSQRWMIKLSNSLQIVVGKRQAHSHPEALALVGTSPLINAIRALSGAALFYSGNEPR